MGLQPATCSLSMLAVELVCLICVACFQGWTEQVKRVPHAVTLSFCFVLLPEAPILCILVCQPATINAHALSIDLARPERPDLKMFPWPIPSYLQVLWHYCNVMPSNNKTGQAEDILGNQWRINLKFGNAPSYYSIYMLCVARLQGNNARTTRGHVNYHLYLPSHRYRLAARDYENHTRPSSQALFPSSPRALREERQTVFCNK